MKTPILTASVLSAMLLAACAAPQAPTGEADAAADARPAPAPTEQGITVSAAWSRAMPPGARVGGGFMTIRNDGDQDDRLVALRSSAAGSVDVHEMREADGMMQMRPVVGGLVIPAGGEVVLKPGGYHLMFMQPVQPFAEGDAIDVTLVFEHAGERQVAFKVLGLGATAPDMGDMGDGVAMDHAGH
ncbi:copper chaperone PCu(A)C [Marilutibacter spongiae]|uniref:Copper chaperone PCu(A)C n=1 Tax=Marilutibacter spongiae TaxID=2025720 RepID=A0A7W3Y5I4_9GAMM|nr:copper chaperone PCu(A)C [Lysobacter spongiae]MBB1060059.1 copper chaperone PCu(A)C [Lysobacter spongiae]